MGKALSRTLVLTIVLGGWQVAAAADADKELHDKALKLNELTGLNAMEGQLRAMLKDSEGTKKLLAVAGKLAEQKPQPFNYNAAFVLARAAHNLKDVDNGLRFYRICRDQAFKLESGAKLVQVFDGLIDLLYANKKYEDAIKECKEFLEIRSESTDDPVTRVKPLVMERMIQSMTRNGDIDKALKMTEELIEADEDGWYFVQLKGWVLREAGKLDDAAQTYIDLIGRLKKNKNLEEKRREGLTDGVRYMLSGIYVDAQKVDKAAEQLQILLKSKPDHPTYNNDLGYIWADHDMNLDESEKLIRKALEEDRKLRKKDPDLTPDEDKDNPAYLDSLGWVLFKKKKLPEAKKYLLEAIEQKEGQHIEILDHLAEVQMALGDKADALKTWKKALELKSDDSSKRDQERRSRVEKKLKENEGK